MCRLISVKRSNWLWIPRWKYLVSSSSVPFLSMVVDTGSLISRPNLFLLFERLGFYNFGNQSTAVQIDYWIRYSHLWFRCFVSRSRTVPSFHCSHSPVMFLSGNCPYPSSSRCIILSTNMPDRQKTPISERIINAAMALNGIFMVWQKIGTK